MPRCPRLALIAALFASSCTAAADQTAEFAGSFSWAKTDEAFFGFSGIELSDDGMSFVVIGDSSQVITGSITRDAGGRIDKMTVQTIGSLRASDGSNIRGTRFEDAEGLTTLPDGGYAVSFEGAHRVNLYSRINGPAKPLPVARAFGSLQANAGLEALAADRNGTLYALPERSGGLTDDFTVFRYRDGAWDIPFSVPRGDGYLVVGADFGPDGSFYLLERQFLGVLGFSTRVRRFSIDRDDIGGGETILETAARVHDNLEGISVWRDVIGGLRLTMVSDNNNLPIQKTEFVEYRLRE